MDPKFFECPVCMEMCRECINCLACNQILCKSHVKSLPENRCPMCRKAPFQWQENVALQRIIREVKERTGEITPPASPRDTTTLPSHSAGPSSAAGTSGGAVPLTPDERSRRRLAAALTQAMRRRGARGEDRAEPTSSRDTTTPPSHSAGPSSAAATSEGTAPPDDASGRRLAAALAQAMRRRGARGEDTSPRDTTTTSSHSTRPSSAAGTIGSTAPDDASRRRAASTLAQAVRRRGARGEDRTVESASPVNGVLAIHGTKTLVREGHWRKEPSPEQETLMTRHVRTCDNPECRSLWRGRWGKFIGGARGSTHFDLTECVEGRRLNELIGWDYSDPSC